MPPVRAIAAELHPWSGPAFPERIDELNNLVAGLHVIVEGLAELRWVTKGIRYGGIRRYRTSDGYLWLYQLIFRTTDDHEILVLFPPRKAGAPGALDRSIAFYHDPQVESAELDRICALLIEKLALAQQ